MPDNASQVEQTAARNALHTDMDGIADALNSASNVLSKCSLFAWFGDCNSGCSGLWAWFGGCSCGCLRLKVHLIVWEVACTLKFAFAKLGFPTFATPATMACGDTILHL